MIRGVLLDLAGVVYEGGHALPGAPEAIARLRNAGLPLRFITNTTRQPKRAIVERLCALGIEATAEDVLTPAALACAWMEQEGCTPHLLIHPDLEEDFAGCPATGESAVVVGDAGPMFTYDALNAAFREIDAGARFLALAANRVFRDTDGELSLDAGPFVRALEHATGRQARVFGKPAPAFYLGAAALLGCAPSAVAMIGDDAEADVAGALIAGIGQGILVRTGKYRLGDEDDYRPRPSRFMRDLPDAVDAILRETSG